MLMFLKSESSKEREKAVKAAKAKAQAEKAAEKVLEDGIRKLKSVS